MSEIGPLTIAVCMKVSPDTAQIKIDLRTGAPRLDAAPRRIGTFDENALEEAVRLKETHGGKVFTLSLVERDPPPELIVRALAMGADEAYVIEDATAGDADSLATTRILAAALKRLGCPDLVLCGEGSLDAYSRQVGPRLAEALRIPSLTHATRVENHDGRLVIHRVLEASTVIVSATPPLLLTVGQEINEPRFPTVLQIMSASGKPVVKWRLRDLGFDERENAAQMSGVATLEVVAPGEARRGIPIAGENAEQQARELAQRLFESGLVKVE